MHYGYVIVHNAYLYLMKHIQFRQANVIILFINDLYFLFVKILLSQVHHNFSYVIGIIYNN